MTAEYTYVDGRVFWLWEPNLAEHLSASVVYGLMRTEQNLFGSRTLRPLYWGIAGDAAERFRQHEKWDEARRQGMDTVIVHYEDSEHQRRLIEQQLITNRPTPLNVQHNPPAYRRLAEVMAGYGVPTRSGALSEDILSRIDLGLPSAPPRPSSFSSAWDFDTNKTPFEPMAPRLGLLGALARRRGE